MFEIGPLTREDIPAALHLSTQAGWNQIDQDWARLIDLDGDACLAGRLDGKVVATATLARYEPAWAWVGMVLVDLACRGQGFGGQIMDAILARAEALNIKSLGLDATDAGRPIYLKHGFEDLVDIDRRRLPGALRRSFTSSAEELHDSDWAGLLQLDRDALGIDRSRLLQRLRADSICRVIRTTKKIGGFGFRRLGKLADQIGPVIAESAEDAQILIQSLAATGWQEPARDLLIDSLRGGPLDGWLDANLFAVSRKLTRMICGPVGGATMSDRRIYAAAGFELG